MVSFWYRSPYGVIAHATTGPYQMDIMDDPPDATARKRFIGIYLDLLHYLTKVIVAGSNPAFPTM